MDRVHALSSPDFSPDSHTLQSDTEEASSPSAMEIFRTAPRPPHSRSASAPSALLNRVSRTSPQANYSSRFNSGQECPEPPAKRRKHTIPRDTSHMSGRRELFPD